MMASAQLGNRLVSAHGAVNREKTMPGGAGPVRPTALTRPLPAPPALVPPAAPATLARLPAAPVPPVPPPTSARPSGRALRLVAAVIVTLAVVGGLGWLAQPGDLGIPQRTTVVRVGAGETVWDVASRVAPRSDQRAVVERIRQLNGMASGAVRPGQQLQVPDGR